MTRQIYRLSVRHLFCMTGLSGLVVLAGVNAGFAIPASCQVDFEKHGTARQAILERINAFNKKRPTASAACATFNELRSVDEAMLKWMGENQDWCQLTDQLLGQFKTSKAQADKVRVNACSAAQKEKTMRAQPQGPGRAGPRPPGSGVRLPAGAL